VSLGIMEAGLRSGVPVLLGVLTCDNVEQAIHRAGGNVGNKGTECAEAALRMVNLLEQLP
jgi:6,7-dimethyl-8-ribityllumazine synthase